MMLLCFQDVLEYVPLFIFPMVFVAIVVTVIIVVVKRAKEAEERRKMSESPASYPFVDGNGRTEHQRNYLNKKRKEQFERKITANDGSHSHIGGKTEKYDKIVGSLGEVDDEGCDELDGVRLIEHDESYCDNPDHIVSADRSEIVKAMILGEVINTPRFKESYRRKR